MGLRGRAEELGIALHEALEVDFAAFGRIADQKGLHLDDIAQGQVHALECRLNGGQRADGLGLGIAVGGDAVLRRFRIGEGGTMPLRKTSVLPAGISTAAAIGNVLPFGSLWRITSCAAPSEGSSRSGQKSRMRLCMTSPRYGIM